MAPGPHHTRRAEPPLRVWRGPSEEATGPPTVRVWSCPFPSEPAARRAADPSCSMAWIGGRAAPLSGEQRDRQPVLAVAVAGEQVAVIQPEAVAAGAGAERRAGERIVPAAAFLAIAGTQRERLLPLPLHSRARVLEVRVGKVDVSRRAQPPRRIRERAADSIVGREIVGAARVLHLAAHVLRRHAEP